MSAVYCVSDVHLGVPDSEQSRKRERLLVRFLEEAARDASAFYLIGDIFDFWYEYKHVVPKGYVRLLGTLAALTDAGIEVRLFAGNHDMWFKSYFPSELGIPVEYEPVTRNFFGKNYFIAHGDGLGPGDNGYKLLKKVIRHPVSVRLFGALHPYWGFTFANLFSSTEKNVRLGRYKVHHGEKEFLPRFAADYARTHPETDYFIFGHRHLAQFCPVGNKSNMIILGDWLTDFCFLRIDPSAAPQLMTYASGTFEPLSIPPRLSTESPN